MQGGASAANYAPGYSELYTEALQRTTSTATIAETSYDLPSHNYRIQASAAHRMDGLFVDYSGTASFSSATQEYLPWSRKPKGVLSITGLNNIGYIIDRRQDRIWPTVTQTSGADMYNLENYTSMTLAQNNRRSDSNIMEGRINARKNFSLAAPAFIKTGLQFQRQRRDTEFDYYSFRFTGPGGLGQFVDRGSWVDDRVNGVRQGPWADLMQVAQHKEDNPGQWTEDYYYHYSQKLLGQKDFKEQIMSGYVMGNVQLGTLNILGGLRVEDTEVDGNGPIRRLTPAEQARRSAWVGPVTEAEAERRAEAEFADRAKALGKYRNVFPGIHFKYAARSGLVARASYSTSIGRPAISSILPNTTVNDAAQTIAIANTELKPQYSDNFDVNIEYYYEPIGLLSASVFLKELSGFIYTDTSQFVGVGPNNGFDGLYENYRISTTANGGRARYRGFELSYQQQFTFLPGFWSGFGVNMNYTQLETEGDYGGAVATTKVAGFTPKTANLAVSYQKNRIKVSATANWLDDYLASVSTNAASIIHEAPRTFVAAKFTYALTPRTNIYLNWDNITKTPVNNRYVGFKERKQLVRAVYPLVAVGVQGRF